MKIIIASDNPVKINAAKQGFERMFLETEINCQGVTVDSGVSHQPKSDEETLLGATNRALNAKIAVSEADYWVGIEGGISEIDGTMEAFAWVIILDKNNKKGKGKSGAFILPLKVADLIREGLELGDADDRIFGMTDSKRQIGAVGILTQGVLDRTGYYEQAVILALIPFVNQDLYP
jgi:inosine/xanthosine triphosphatase